MTEQGKFTIVPVIQTVVTGFKRVPVYDFDELPEDVQQRLIDDYNREALERDFFELDIDFYIDELKEMIWQKYNLPIFDIHYDLSYGPEATFETDEIYGIDLEKFVKKAFPDFVRSFRFGLFNDFIASVILEFAPTRCSSRNNLYLEGDFYPDEYHYIDEYLDSKLYDLELLLKEFSDNLSDKIADRLYKGYEYSYSDENVIEQLRCNRYFKDGTEV